MHRFVTVTIVGFWAVLGRAVALWPLALQVLAAATFALWQNESRPDFSDVAGAAVETPADRLVDRDGQFVSVTGALKGDGPKEDATFFSGGDHYQVVRVVETYAWVEQRRESSRALWGGSREVEEVVEYVQIWTAEPPRTDDFEHPEGHENPLPRYRTHVEAANAATVGRWSVAPAATLVLAGEPLDTSRVTWTDEGAALVPHEDGWRYDRAGAADAPELGDQRFQWLVIPNGLQMTVFGDASGEWVGPHEWVEGLPLALAVPGTRAEALDFFHGLHVIALWFVRLAGAFAVWLGLMWLVSPLLVVFDIAPPVGLVVRFVVGVALSFVALAWALVVAGLSIALHSPVILLILAGVAYIVIRAWWDARRERKEFERAAAMGSQGG